MSAYLSLDVIQTSSGDVGFVPSLHNDGDKTITFTTASAKLFDLDVKTVEGESVNGASMAATQAVVTREVPPGQSLSSTIVWECKDKWKEIHNRWDDMEFNPDEMYEDFPEEYDEVVVSVQVGSDDPSVDNLSLTQSVKVP